jgi:ABC-2 type transport system ATP-binding protein
MASELAAALAAPGVQVERTAPDVLEVHGLASEQIGALAAERGFVLHELTPRQASLEDAFMRLTRESVEYGAAEPAPELTAA